MRKINEILEVYLRKEVNKHSWNHFVALSSSTSHQFGGKFCFDLEISCCAHVKLGLFFLLTTETITEAVSQPKLRTILAHAVLWACITRA